MNSYLSQGGQPAWNLVAQLRKLAGYVFLAGESLWANKLRTGLTLAAISIGVCGLVSVYGLSRATIDGIGSSIAAGGPPGYSVLVDQSQDEPDVAALQYRDARSLADRIAQISSANAVYLPQLHNFKARYETSSDVVSVGSVIGARENGGMTIIYGRALDTADSAVGKKVAVISDEVARSLFGNEEGAVGKIIQIGSESVAVVGVFRVSGSLFNSLLSETIFLPTSTMKDMVGNTVDEIHYWIADPSYASTAQSAILSELQVIHGPRALYTVTDNATALGAFISIINIVGVGLSGMGAIALIVAGVGIMNIMLIAVRERTSEIGLRMAIGARRREIVLQFMIEAILLALVGAWVGLTIAAALILAGAHSIGTFVGSAPVPWLQLVILSNAMALTLGLCFGAMPAVRASRLSPIDAIRATVR